MREKINTCKQIIVYQPITAIKKNTVVITARCEPNIKKKKNLQGLVFSPKTEKLFLWDLNGKEKRKSLIKWPQNTI